MRPEASAGGAHRDPKVTIGMPVYNGQRYIREALDSLLSQTFQDFELVISDNASTDATPEICREYAARHPCIRYVRHPTNMDAPANFNYLLSIARSEYFMWAASDDRWDRRFVERLVEGMNRDGRYALAFCPYGFIDEAGRLLDRYRRYNYSSRSRLGRVLKLCLYYDDGCVYGLYRRRMLGDARIRQWKWMNREVPLNVAYPFLFRCLAAGDYVLCGTEPMWFSRLKAPTYPHTPYPGRHLLSYVAFIIRKLNVLGESLRGIYAGSRSLWVTLGAFPVLAVRCASDCFAYLIEILMRRMRKLRRSEGASSG